MANEPTVTLESLPAGYSFVPKGNVYITGNCRKKTQGAHKTVYLVVKATTDDQIGIAVPDDIYDAVRRMEVETRADRAKNVEKKDASIEKVFDKVIREEFPDIPAASLPQVLRVALQKGKRKVGRTGTLDMRQKAQLAVRAHIRHCHTPYDHLMRARGGSLSKHKAREAVQEQVDTIARSWGGSVSAKRARRRAGPSPAAVKAAAAASATAPPKMATPDGDGDGQQKHRLGQRPLPMRPSKPVPPVAADTVIDLTHDDPPQRVLPPRGSLQMIAGKGDAQATQTAPNPTGLPKVAFNLATRAKEANQKKKMKKMKGKRRKRPARELPSKPVRVTRSMQHIEETMQDLAKRLPDSPEPEKTPPPTPRAQW